MKESQPSNSSSNDCSRAKRNSERGKCPSRTKSVMGKD